MPEAAAPLSYRLATIVVLVETVIVWAYVVLLTVDGWGLAGAWRVIGYFALYAIGFTFLAWALVRRQRWVRAPLIVLHLLVAAMGFSFLGAGARLAATLMIVVPMCCVGLLMAPGTREAIGIRGDG